MANDSGNFAVILTVKLVIPILCSNDRLLGRLIIFYDQFQETYVVPYLDTLLLICGINIPTTYFSIGIFENWAIYIMLLRTDSPPRVNRNAPSENPIIEGDRSVLTAPPR